MDVNNNHFGSRVREIRRAKNITQQQLAQEVGVSVSFIGHIERGFRNISIDKLPLLCKALDVSPDDLLKDHSSSHLPNRTQSELLMNDPDFVMNVLELAQKIVQRWDTLRSENAISSPMNNKKAESKEESEA